jgi:hypothetical protein
MSASMTNDKHACILWSVDDGEFLVIHWTEVPPGPGKSFGTWRIKLSDARSVQMSASGNAIVIDDTICVPFFHNFMTEEERKRGRRGAALLSDAMHAVFTGGRQKVHFITKWNARDQ